LLLCSQLAEEASPSPPCQVHCSRFHLFDARLEWCGPPPSFFPPSPACLLPPPPHLAFSSPQYNEHGGTEKKGRWFPSSFTLILSTVDCVAACHIFPLALPCVLTLAGFSWVFPPVPPTSTKKLPVFFFPLFPSSFTLPFFCSKLKTGPFGDGFEGFAGQLRSEIHFFFFLFFVFFV